MGGQKGLCDHQVAVDEDDHITTGVIHAAVPTLRRTTVLLLNQAHMGKTNGLLPQPRRRSIAGTVVDHNDFVVLNSSSKLLIF